MADLVEDGTLRVEWYDLAQITESTLAAQAGIAAGEQGRSTSLRRRLRSRRPDGAPQYSQDALVDFAAKAGVSDLEKFRATMLDEHTAAKVSAAKNAPTRRASPAPPMFINKAFISGYRDAPTCARRLWTRLLRPSPEIPASPA